MKRFFLVALTASVSLLMRAERVEIGQLYYDINADDLTAEVRPHLNGAGFNYPDLTGIVTIPTTITVGNTDYTVTAIGNSAFYTCEGIEGAVLPPSITRIGNYAFSECIKFHNITMPSSVSEIGLGAFSSTSLRQIELTGDITTISSTAFAGTDIERIKLPSSVRSIGDNAFAGCSVLREIDLGDNLTDIGDGAFARCKALETIEFPATLQTIGQRAFNGCASLRSIDLKHVNTIGRNAFEKCASLSEIDFGSGDLSIAYSAFAECTALKDIVIPANVTEIAQYAFYDCLSIESLRFENGEKTLTLGHAPFANDPIVKMFVGRNIETSTKNDNVFSSNKNLTHLTLGDGVTSVPAELFSYLSALEEVDFGANVSQVGSDAFASCPLLKTVKCASIADWVKIDFLSYTANPLNYGADLYIDGTLLTSITLSDNITRIGSNNFTGYSRLTDITLPSSLTSIGDQAFMYCSGLKTVAFGGAIPFIGGRAFKDCTSLGEVYCPSLEAWLGNGFETALSNPLCYGAHLYAAGTQIEDIAIPAGFSSVGKYAFTDYTPVSHAEICGDVTEIGRSAFEDCTKLTEIELGAAMKTLGKRAFNGAPLNAITSRNPIPPAFDTDGTIATFSSYNAVVYVPTGSLEVYRTDKSWRNFANIVEKDFSGIDNALDPACETFILAGKEITALCDIRIHDLGGRETAHMHAGTRLSLDPGVYIVSSPTATFKIAVRR